MMTKRTLLITAVIFLVGGSEGVHACSCGTPSPCEAYSGASAVFIGYVRKVEAKGLKKDEDGNEYGDDAQVAYVQVEKSFKGAAQPEIILHQPGGTCSPTFEVGQRLLFYAGYDRQSKKWEVGGCGRTTSLEHAGDDLLYLRGLPQSATRTRISGEIKHYEDDPEQGFSFVKYIAGAKVKIVGASKVYEIYTDKNGVYEVYDLPPGKYSIEPEIPLGLKLRFPIPFGPLKYSSDRTFAVELKPHSCAGSDYILNSDNSIKGKIYGANGELMPKVCLELLSTTAKTVDPYFRVSDCTDEGGSYELKNMPPGEYLIVVNKDGKVSGYEPFQTLYYPGVFEKEKATIITIGEGDKREAYDIHVPSQLATNVIEGVLLYSDGRPAAREIVSFDVEDKDERHQGNSGALTDDQGRFSFTVIRGTVGWLRAKISVYELKYSNCPQAEKLLAASDKSVIDLETRAIKLEANRDIRDLKLTIPFAYCPRAE